MSYKENPNYDTFDFIKNIVDVNNKCNHEGALEFKIFEGTMHLFCNKCKKIQNIRR